MADETNSAQAQASTIALKIFTQQPPPDTILHLQDIPSDSTVGQLKERIRDTITSHPAVERQRLIYRGRALLNPEISLLSILGQEEIRRADAVHVFHLVVFGETAPAQRMFPNTTVTQPSPTPQPHDDLHNFQDTATPRAGGQSGLGGNWHGAHPPFGMPQQTPGQLGGAAHAPHAHHTFTTFTNRDQAFPHHLPPPQHMHIHGQPLPHHSLHGRADPLDGIRQHLQQTISNTPPGPVRDALQQHLAAIGEPARQGHGHSSNIGQADATAEAPSNNGDGPAQHAQTGYQREASSANEAQRDILQDAPRNEIVIPQAQNGRDSLAYSANSQLPARGNEPRTAQPARESNPNQENSATDHGNEEEARTVDPTRVSEQSREHNYNSTMRRMLVSRIDHDYLFRRSLDDVADFEQQTRRDAFAIDRYNSWFANHNALTQAETQILLLERACAEAFSFYGFATTDVRERSARFVEQLLRRIVVCRNTAQTSLNTTIGQGQTWPTYLWNENTLETLLGLNQRFQDMVSSTTSIIDKWRRWQHIPLPASVSGVGSSVRLERRRAGVEENANLPALVDSVAPPLQENGAAAPVQQQTPTVTAYLLNSPSGPYAIVYSSQGSFTSVRGLPQQHQQQFPGGQLRRPMQAQQAMRMQPGQVDFFGPLAPILRAGWLLIRILGFVWLFTAGTISTRSIFILVVSLVFWAFMSGMFGDHGDRLQRRWERFLGLEGDGADRQGRNEGQGEQRAANAVAPQQPGNVQAQAEPAQQAGGALTPQQVADRMLREHEEQNRGWIRERLRTVERTAALFLASLYPGIGERHVRQRERLRREADERARQLAVAEAAEEARRAEDARSGSQDVANEQQAEAEPASADENKEAPDLRGSVATADEASSSSVALHGNSESSRMTRRREVSEEGEGG